MTVWAVALWWRSRAELTNRMKETLSDVTVKVSDRFLTTSQDLGILQGQKQPKCLGYYFYCVEEHQWTIVYQLQEFKVACVEVSLTAGLFPEGARREEDGLRWVMLWMLALHILASPSPLIYSPDLKASGRFTNYITSVGELSCV